MQFPLLILLHDYNSYQACSLSVSVLFDLSWCGWYSLWEKKIKQIYYITINELVYIPTLTYWLSWQCKKYLLEKCTKRVVIACAFHKGGAIVKNIWIKLTCNNKMFFDLAAVIWVNFQYFDNCYNILLLRFSYRHGLIHFKPSCFFWMTFDTKYIQTSNLKLSFENWEHLLKFIAWMNFFHWIWYSAYYEKQKINTYFIPSKVCFAVKNVPLDIE